MSHSAEYKENLMDVADVLERYRQLFDRLIKITKDEDLKITYMALQSLSDFLGRSYLVSVNILKEVNVLFNAIQNLPRRSEYEEIKNMVEKQKESIVSTLIPIKEAFERSVEFENFGRDRTKDTSEKSE